MKTLLCSAFLFAASFSSSFAQNQQSVAANNWGDEPTATAATVADETPRYNTGWNTAPGQSLSLHDRPSTDYWGRPLKKKAANLTTAAAKRKVAYQEEESTDPMMKSSGVMIASGMNTAPYRRVSTDYWGRPLKRKSKGASTLANKVAKSSPVAVNTAGSW